MSRRVTPQCARIAACCLLATLWACTGEPSGGIPVATDAPGAMLSTTSAPGSSGAAGQASGADQTAEMAATLALSAAALDPATNTNINARRVAWLQAQPRPADPQQALVREFDLGNELLRAGEPLEAIGRLENVRAALGSADLASNEALQDVTLLLAVAWLRLGEQENCALDHNLDSCLLPIQGGGVHALDRGSRGAVRELERYLRAVPDDVIARWLLNIAAMTLAEYPDGVAPEWRIDPATFASDHDIGRFFDVAPAVGVDHIGRAGGSILDDLDGDGDLDLLVSSWGPTDPLALFLNAGDGRFEDATARSGLDGIVGGLNMVHADYDGDGDRDVFVLRGGWFGADGGIPNSLLQNQGDGTFVDVTRAAGVLSRHPTQTAAWADLDADGDLDLYVGNETERGGSVHPNELYQNQGDGTFVDVAPALGADLQGFHKGVAIGDFDDDGFPDIYVSRIGGPNALLRNGGIGANGTWAPFQDVAAAAGVTEPFNSFPTWFWDYDNDGRLDLFVSGYGHPTRFLDGAAADVVSDVLGLPTDAERPRLYRNRGDGTFEDVTRPAGLWTVLLTMGTNFGDLDNDGWEDFYAGTGDPDFRTLIPNRMFRSAGDGTFQDVTTSGGFGHLQKGHGVSFGDVDGDGDQDVHQVMGGAYEGDWYPNVFFENPGHGNRWVTLRLVGAGANRDGIGARIRVDVDGPDGARSIHRVVSSGGSFGGNSLQQEIGLGQASTIARLVVRWPAGGTEQVFERVAPGRAYLVREGAGALEPIDLRPIDLADPLPPGEGGHGAAPHAP